MNDDNEFGYRIRQVLNQGTGELDCKVSDRLHEARRTALGRYQFMAQVGLAGIGQAAGDAMYPHLRTLAAILALTVGAVGAYYWNMFQQAADNEDIDSALLSDELPPSAYLDRGFQAWLERASPSPSSE